MPEKNADVIATRASLLERMKDWRDQPSWQEFFDTYWRLIYNVARKACLTDPEAQDVVQEVMISVAKDMLQFKYDPKKGSFKSWLLIKTRWKIVEQFRKRKSRNNDTFQIGPEKHGTSFLEKVPDPNSLITEAVWEEEWRQRLFAAALAKVKLKIGPEKAQIFDFYVLKAWKAEKVAEEFSVSTEIVRTTKHRVKEMIEAEVQRLERETT